MEELYQETATDYLSRFKSLGREGFLGLHPHPVLLASQRAPTTRKRLFMLKTITNEIRGIAVQDDLEIRLNDEVLQARVIPVDKREADSPGHMIFLGRSSRNDVVIADTMVSKLHAYFCQLPGDAGYQLVDMNSTNGTFVNGERLLPSVKKTLRDADEVAFGPGAKLIFFSAPGFCELLKELDQDASRESGPDSGARPAGLAGERCPQARTTKKFAESFKKILDLGPYPAVGFRSKGDASLPWCPLPLSAFVRLADRGSYFGDPSSSPSP